MEIFYENAGKNKRINFDGKKYEISDMDAFRHEFEQIEENDRIKRFKRGIQSYEIEANVCDTETEPWSKLYDQMIEIFDGDVLNAAPGTLHINKSYMQCFVYGSYPKEIFTDWGFQITELKIITDRPVWTVETAYSFKAGDVYSGNSKRYPYKYPYRYANGLTGASIINDHFTETHFKMTIYGPVINPMVIIGQHKYLVNILLEAGEYLAINSREGTVYKVMNSGQIVNAFHNRDKENDLFQPIIPGRHPVEWSGKFDIDLTLYAERSEPLWQ